MYLHYCVPKSLSWVNAKQHPIDVPIVLLIQLHSTFKTNKQSDKILLNKYKIIFKSHDRIHSNISGTQISVFPCTV